MPSRHHLVALALCGALAACTVPIHTGLGGPQGSQPPAERDWEKSTQKAADAVERGDLEAAQKHLEKAQRAAAAEPEGDEYAASLMNLGHVHSVKGDAGNALVFYERALAIREQRLGPDHLEVANTLNTLGATYAYLQRYDDAERSFKRALDIRERKLGENNVLTGQSLNNLALLYAGRGKLSEAEPLYERAIEVIQKAPGGSRADLIRILDNYAALLEDEGRKDDAAKVRARAKEERKEYDRFHDDLTPAQ